jgi:hypothetical protein
MFPLKQKRILQTNPSGKRKLRLSVGRLRHGVDFRKDIYSERAIVAKFIPQVATGHKCGFFAREDNGRARSQYQSGHALGTQRGCPANASATRSLEVFHIGRSRFDRSCGRSSDPA